MGCGHCASIVGQWQLLERAESIREIGEEPTSAHEFRREALRRGVDALAWALPGGSAQLKATLDGIAANLLADRLRDLEASGVIERQVGDTGDVVYVLTSWGAQPREPVESLIRWSTPLMITGPGRDTFSPRWLDSS